MPGYIAPVSVSDTAETQNAVSAAFSATAITEKCGLSWSQVAAVSSSTANVNIS